MVQLSAQRPGPASAGARPLAGGQGRMPLPEASISHGLTPRPVLTLPQASGHKLQGLELSKTEKLTGVLPPAAPMKPPPPPPGIVPRLPPARCAPDASRGDAFRTGPPARDALSQVTFSALT